ncbi:MAG: bifunctional 2-C-methyl-D-erythritol 4-phosphate cytidylyltransferase/2-C-methyl-D-erythritol 2,4-cyclodiphosphate synthase [Alphaproteobacteria bacterium]|nr:MAG: bifunctional 2-C-methyl-D-erythritol 4-phosphate cytidylyltransferase/2-C-methyl-D-erythritol 2,4-cyclodiphosphate synthase [Alphaproteobacteria bacterium]
MAIRVAAVVVAAGRGTRAGLDYPKQYKVMGGSPMVRESLRVFSTHPEVDLVLPVIHPDDGVRFAAAAEGLAAAEPVPGAATRQGSVRAGLEALSTKAPAIVLVHDAARPFTSAALVSRAIAAAAKSGAAVPGLPVTDTVKLVDGDGGVAATLNRAALRTVQTPQAFAYPALLDAHRRAAAQGREDFPDDAALAEWAGLKVAVFEGEPGNIKMTTPDDFARAERDVHAGLTDIRTGIGYDIHAFDTGGDHVWLGGIKIAHARKLAGHSDADVALHALTDAILGALADGDIGVHFPPSDAQWRGASSDTFLKFAVERVRARGGQVSHLDVAIVCEAPKVNPHRDTMRARIAAIAGLSIDRVGVKATTNEKLGAIGNGEGIAAYATATIRLPWSAP